MVADTGNPGPSLTRYRLDGPVGSCESAAAAKGVPLEHELKSLVLEYDAGLALVHIRGDRRLWLRAVKRSLPSRQAKLVGKDVLANLGVEMGTVTPFHPVLWELPQLISREVLALPWVTTNAGVLDEYVIFAPSLLLRARDTKIGDLSLAA